MVEGMSEAEAAELEHQMEVTGAIVDMLGFMHVRVPNGISMDMPDGHTMTVTYPESLQHPVVEHRCRRCGEVIQTTEHSTSPDRGLSQFSAQMAARAGADMYEAHLEVCPVIPRMWLPASSDSASMLARAVWATCRRFECPEIAEGGRGVYVAELDGDVSMQHGTDSVTFVSPRSPREVKRWLEEKHGGTGDGS